MITLVPMINQRRKRYILPDVILLPLPSYILNSIIISIARFSCFSLTRANQNFGFRSQLGHNNVGRFSSKKKGDYQLQKSNCWQTDYISSPQTLIEFWFPNLIDINDDAETFRERNFFQWNS